MLGRLSITILLIPTLMLAAGWLGSLHSVFDSIAVFRQPILWLALFSLVLMTRLKAYKAAVLVLGVCVLSSGFLWPVAKGSFGSHILYQKNMSFRMSDQKPLLDDILQSKAQFVTLQEVTDKNKVILDGLAASLPSQQYCDFARVGGVAVASIFPKVAGSGYCSGNGVVAMQVETGKGPTWVISVHLHWPWPYGQPEQVKAILSDLSGLSGPKIIGGDFNMVPWTHRIKQFGLATGTQVMPGVYRSHPLHKMFIIPIDHVFIPAPNGAEFGLRRPFLGSDHYGVLAHFSL